MPHIEAHVHLRTSDAHPGYKYIHCLARMVLHFYSLQNAMLKEVVAGGRSGCSVCIVHDVTLPVWPGAMLDVEQQASLCSGLPSSLTISAQASGCLESVHTHALPHSHTHSDWLAQVAMEDAG